MSCSTTLPPRVRGMKALAKATALIRGAQRIICICHVMPDGDAIGSLVGLGLALRKMGKRCTLACADPVPERLRFLPGVAEVQPVTPTDEDLIITLDCSDTERIGALYDATLFARKRVLNIDHHITNVAFGDVNWVEQRAATAELCLELITKLAIPLDVAIATCLLTGVVTDTRSFRTSNTTPEVLRVAIRLLEAGASLADINEQLSQYNSPGRICLWGRALSNARMQQRVIWAEITPDLLATCNATTEDTEDLVSFLVATRDMDVALLFTDRGGGKIEVSMRAVRGVDISGVALQFGGGGHPQAAGCTCNGALPEVKARVLQATITALRVQGRLS